MTRDTVEAPVSGHIGNSEKMTQTQQRVVAAYESFKDKVCDIIMVTNSIVVITLNSLLMSITEEARQRTIGAYVTYYSKSDQDVNASIKVKL